MIPGQRRVHSTIGNSCSSSWWNWMGNCLAKSTRVSSDLLWRHRSHVLCSPLMPRLLGWGVAWKTPSETFFVLSDSSQKCSWYRSIRWRHAEINFPLFINNDDIMPIWIPHILTPICHILYKFNPYVLSSYHIYCWVPSLFLLSHHAIKVVLVG